MHAGSGNTVRSMTNLLHECAAAFAATKPFVGNPPEYLSFFRSVATKRALHAESASSVWSCFNSTVYPRFQLDLVRSYRWAMEWIVNEHPGVRVLLYSGELDLHYNYLALDAWTRQMKWPGQTSLVAAPLRPWVPGLIDTLFPQTPWGATRQVGNVTILRVAGAGHETCRDLPHVCPAYFRDFVLAK